MEQTAAQLEVELVGRLTEIGCPVGPMDPRAEPLVYERGAFGVTLWDYCEPVARRLSPVDFARALERLHAGMRRIDVSVPGFRDRITEAEEIIANPDRSPELAAGDRTFLGGRLGHLRRAIDDRGAVEQLLHGEPHPGNVINSKDGPLFIDLETCCHGPIEFDLAHVPGAVCEHYPNVDHGLLNECRQLVLAMVAAWRWEIGDRFPDGRRSGEALLRALHEGPPWPTLDEMNTRLDGLKESPKIT
ncbi:MAG TPA: phosphotransferase [Thermomicrobiales bacterium]|nr:phosphotransferase [Thermomicrobiales bacterium]